MEVIRWERVGSAAGETVGISPGARHAVLCSLALTVRLDFDDFGCFGDIHACARI